MKKYISILLTIFLTPILVNAETLTYNVCTSGCEYTNLRDVKTNINNISDLSDKDIIININSTTDGGQYDIGSKNNVVNSIIINGNNNSFGFSWLSLYAKKINIDSCNAIYQIVHYNSEKTNIRNTALNALLLYFTDLNGQIKTEEVNISKILEIDEYSLNNLNNIVFAGNIKLENMDFSNQMIENGMGNLNIYNSKIGKILTMATEDNSITNIYNSTFNSLKYINMISMEQFEDEFYSYMTNYINPDISTLNYDIYDINIPDMGSQGISITTVYFDKETELKPGDKLDLVDYLDYYTEDKEIEYTIEDESIAKIENKELTTLKEGSTKVTVTTDDGHIIYRINLVVKKETIPEKIDKMSIKVPITGSKVKAWVVVISAMLLGIVGVCTSLLIKKK